MQLPNIENHVLVGDFEAFSEQFARWIDAQVAQGGS